jgi:hypothetical protein
LTNTTSRRICSSMKEEVKIDLYFPTKIASGLRSAWLLSRQPAIWPKASSVPQLRFHYKADPRRTIQTRSCAMEPDPPAHSSIGDLHAPDLHPEPSSLWLDWAWSVTAYPAMGSSGLHSYRNSQVGTRTEKETRSPSRCVCQLCSTWMCASEVIAQPRARDIPDDKAPLAQLVAIGRTCDPHGT